MFPCFREFFSRITCTKIFLFFLRIGAYRRERRCPSRLDACAPVTVSTRYRPADKPLLNSPTFVQSASFERNSHAGRATTSLRGHTDYVTVHRLSTVSIQAIPNRKNITRTFVFFSIVIFNFSWSPGGVRSPGDAEVYSAAMYVWNTSAFYSNFIVILSQFHRNFLSIGSLMAPKLQC